MAPTNNRMKNQVGAGEESARCLLSGNPADNCDKAEESPDSQPFEECICDFSEPHQQKKEEKNKVEDDKIQRWGMTQSQWDLSCSIRRAASDVSLTEALLPGCFFFFFLVRKGEPIVCNHRAT